MRKARGQECAGQWVRRIENCVPVIGKEDPGGKQAMVFGAARVDHLRHKSKFRFRKSLSSRQNATGDKEKPVRHDQTAQARHGADYKPPAPGCNRDFECVNSRSRAAEERWTSRTSSLPTSGLPAEDIVRCSDLQAEVSIGHSSPGKSGRRPEP
jgi:hypothetical protein